MTTPDIPRLQTLLAWATAEDQKRRAGKPSEWDQGRWANWCGTTCCIAGKVLLEDGATPVLSGIGGDLVFSFTLPNGSRVDPGSYGRSALGLDYDQATVLFHADNDLDDLTTIIAAIENGDDETIEDFLDRD